MAIITRKMSDGSSAIMFDGTLDASTTTAQGKHPTPMAQMGSFFIKAVDPTGFSATVTVWASNLPNPDAAVDLDWVDISSALTIPTIVTIGASTNYLIQIPPDFGGACFYRIDLERSAGDSQVAIVSCFKKLK